MNAYLFAAVATRSQVRSAAGCYDESSTIDTWDSCTSQIVFGDSPTGAQRRFEAWLRATPEGEEAAEVQIRKIAAAQFVDQLFAESENQPLNWLEILKQVESAAQSTPVDEFEPGYWVDVDRVVRPDKMSFSVNTLPSDVPEEIRSGLNWSSDRQFLFILSVLSPPMPPAEPADEPETDDNDLAQSSDEGDENSEPIGIGELFTTFPQALDKEAAALIQARNSVVAAWLWRRYAANTRLSTNSIRIDPWCGVIGLDGADGK